MGRKCEICGLRDARYICDSCGRSVCEDCFDPRRWVCTICLSEVNSEGRHSTWASIDYPESWLLRFLFIGFVTVVIGMTIMVASSLFSGVGEVSGGAVFFIGPIPIILSYGPHSILILALAMILTILGAILFFGVGKRSSQET